MAHVMNYDELVEAFQSRTIVYEEMRSFRRIRPMRSNGVDFIGVDDQSMLSLMDCDETVKPDYNYYFRVWNENPTDEERAETRWVDKDAAK